MARKKSPPMDSPNNTQKESNPDEAIHRYEEILDQISRFTRAIAGQEEAITQARFAVAEAKENFEDKKKKLQELESVRDGVKDTLFAFLSPESGEILPLFDTMKPADEEKHGKNSSDWRKEPIAVLQLSLLSLKALTEADIVMVGQLQDRVIEGDTKWWDKIDGLTPGSAAAIVDRLNDFIFDRTQR